ncbi:MAG: hypothetical protein ACRCTQ_03810 [Brevinemataceae bacterium]
MDFNWIYLGLSFCLAVILSTLSYTVGLNRTVKRLLTLLSAFVISGLVTYISQLILNKDSIISNITACIGTVLLYIIFFPILNKFDSNRYQKISKNSRIVAGMIGIIESWCIISFVTFFINIFIPVSKTTLLEQVLLIPINFFWFSFL